MRFGKIFLLKSFIIISLLFLASCKSQQNLEKEFNETILKINDKILVIISNLNKDVDLTGNITSLKKDVEKLNKISIDLGGRYKQQAELYISITEKIEQAYNKKLNQQYYKDDLSKILFMLTNSTRI